MNRKEELELIIVKSTGLISNISKMKEQVESELAKLTGASPSIGSEPKRGTWFIHRGRNEYYQFNKSENDVIILVRHNNTKRLSKKEFISQFVEATQVDIERHLRYLDSRMLTSLPTPIFDLIPNTVNKIVNMFGRPEYKETRQDFINRTIENKSLIETFKTLSKPVEKGFDITKCDFYMVSVGNVENSSKTRHPSYEKAETEALRLCKLTQKETFILGVVASVKPVKKTETIITVTPTISKR